MIGRNPCQVERAGVERAAERSVPSVAEVTTLSEAIAPRFRVLVILAAWCGLRRGELLALRRRDVDVARGTVRVERALSQMADGKLIVGPPKTEAGRRTVAIPPHVIPVLITHLAAYTAEDLDALVFTGEKGGPVRPHVLQQAWVRAKQATTLPQYHLHDLRHASNTWAAATGASTKELMARMGHASSEAALRYQHASADRDRTIAAALSAMADVAGADAGADPDQPEAARLEPAGGRSEGPRSAAGGARPRAGSAPTRDKRAMAEEVVPDNEARPSL